MQHSGHIFRHGFKHFEHGAAGHGEGVGGWGVVGFGWFGVAGAHGDHAAQQAADRIAAMLDPQQMQQAAARLGELQKSIRGE